MLSRLRPHLTFANVASGLSLFLVLTGGTAWAIDEWTGANIVDGSLTTADYKNNDIRSNDVKNFSLGNGDLLSGSVDTRVATDNSLTGDDIANQSGVDTCTHQTVRVGELCVGGANEHHTWFQAFNLCGNLELRPPSLGEAISLARNYDVPGVDGTEFFWTEERVDDWDPNQAVNKNLALLVDENGILGADLIGNTAETVCVTTPTN